MQDLFKIQTKICMIEPYNSPVQEDYTRKSGNTERGSKKSKSGASSGKAKKVLIALGSAAAASALAYGAYKLHKSGFMNKFAKDTLSKHGLGGGGTSDLIFGRLNPDKLSLNEKLKRCNPLYKTDKKFQYNCGGCTLAYEMINQGYDVQAMPNTCGMALSHMGRFITDLKSDSLKKIESVEDVPALVSGVFSRMRLGRLTAADRSYLLQRSAMVEKALSKDISAAYPSGSRGNLFLRLTNFNHWISWENNNGTIQFYDPQNPNNSLKKLFAFVSSDNRLVSTTAIRLDNVHFNMNTIQEVVADGKIDLQNAKQVFNAMVEYGDGFVFDI